jgi:hypothetical protein
MADHLHRHRDHRHVRRRVRSAGVAFHRVMDTLWSYRPPMKYHPSYGLAFDLHEQVVAYADDHGIKAASQHYNIGVSTIYRWRYNLRR